MISPYASITDFIRFQPSPPKNKQKAHKKTRRIKHRQPEPYWIYQWLCKVNQPKLHYLQINTCHPKMAQPQKTHPRATHWKTTPHLPVSMFSNVIHPAGCAKRARRRWYSSKSTISRIRTEVPGGDWSSCRVCSGGWWNRETCYLSTENRILHPDLRGQTK